jgi:CubicO group peptidase (beta-lactamase class C family)
MGIHHQRITRSLRHAFACCLALLSGAAAAQDDSGAGAPAPLDAAVSGEPVERLRPLADRFVGTVVMRDMIPGAIVGVSQGGRRGYVGYSGSGGAAYGPDTIVEIGSITKVFTTALFAEAVAAGRMQPDAPIQAYMPDRQLRPCAGQITPLQLADFTSGMPELPGNAPRALAERGIDTYTASDFLDWVARWEPESRGGCGSPAPYRYSNASVGLLGYLVAERLGQPWETLVRARITGPLRMTSTTVRVPPEHRDRVARGYGVEGQPVMPWPVFAWYPAGALRSTAADMLAYGEAALGHDRVNGEAVPQSLTQALRTAMRPIYQPEGRDFCQGMAWIENVGDADAGQRPVFLKVGGTDGFNSVLVINPGKNLVVFIAASRPGLPIERMGVALSRHLP